MQLNEIEIAGIRRLFQDGQSLEEIQSQMPKNKSKLVAQLTEELEGEAYEAEQEQEIKADLLDEWEPVFEIAEGRMRRAGVPEPDINRIFNKLRTELNLEDLDPNPDQLYLYCIQQWGGGNLIGKKSEAGRGGVFSMNAAASGTKESNAALRSNVKSPIEANICRPNDRADKPWR